MTNIYIISKMNEYIFRLNAKIGVDCPKLSKITDN